MANSRRKPLRLDSWDYTQPAIYHVTICIADHTHRLGRPRDTFIELSPAGMMVEHQLLALPERFPSVLLGIDSYAIMPNHIHVLIEMNLYCADAQRIDIFRPIQAFKSITTREYGIGVRNHGWSPYRGILWQKRYYETIMRDESWLERHRRYLANNPANWWRDPEAFHRFSRQDDEINNLR